MEQIRGTGQGHRSGVSFASNFVSVFCFTLSNFVSVVTQLFDFGSSILGSFTFALAALASP